MDGRPQFVGRIGPQPGAVGAAGGEGVFYGPRGVAVDANGRVFVSDTGNKRGKRERE